MIHFAPFTGEARRCPQAGRPRLFADNILLTDTRSFAALPASPRKAEWIVYARRPFGAPQAVLAHPSRYTHHVAFANSRLIAFDQQGATFG